jgi:hypothetical protein
MNGFIEKEIDKKWVPFLDRIFKVVQKDGFICGGFTRNILLELHKTDASDIDVYCINDDAFEILKTRLIEAGYVADKETPMSILYKTLFIGEYPIQLIKPMAKGHVQTVGELKEIIENFDFSCIRAGVYQKEDGSYGALVDEDFDEDNGKKKLKIKNIHCPIAEIFRVGKYISKGFRLPPLEALKILCDWEGRDDEYRLKIKDYLEKEELTPEDIDVLEKMLHID